MSRPSRTSDRQLSDKTQSSPSPSLEQHVRRKKLRERGLSSKYTSTPSNNKKVRKNTKPEEITPESLDRETNRVSLMNYKDSKSKSRKSMINSKKKGKSKRESSENRYFSNEDE